MLTYLDPILFPDECIIYEIKNRYVYSIFKNGSSSLVKAKGRILTTSEITSLKEVDIFLRDPFDRYISGVQTYINNIGQEYDKETVLKLISQFLFLNRHFALQFHWIINLTRFTEARLHFRHINELNMFTDHVSNSSIRNQILVEYFRDNKKLQFYLLLDKVLYEEFLGETVSFKIILQTIKEKYSDLYNEIIQRSINLGKTIYV